jgi:hypothetical protein
MKLTKNEETGRSGHIYKYLEKLGQKFKKPNCRIPFAGK